MLIRAKIFLHQLEMKSLSPNRYAWYRPAIQFALPLKLKPSRQDTTVTRRVLYSIYPTLNKQV